MCSHGRSSQNRVRPCVRVIDSLRANCVRDNTSSEGDISDTDTIDTDDEAAIVSDCLAIISDDATSI